jgi:hypothetical protein
MVFRRAKLIQYFRKKGNDKVQRYALSSGGTMPASNGKMKEFAVEYILPYLTGSYERAAFRPFDSI